MTWALPWVLAAAAAGALVVGLLHLVTRRPPTPWPLPTARFLPVGDAPSQSMQRALDDRRLLLLRLLALTLLGVGVAGARCDAAAPAVGHVVVVDRALARDSVRLLATVVENGRPVPRSAIQLALTPIAEQPAATFVDALAAAAALGRRQPAMERVALHVRLPDSLVADDGWRAWRAQWPAFMDMQVIGGSESAPARAKTAPPMSPPVIRWPPRSGEATALRGFARRRIADTVGALVSGGLPIVAPWTRRWEAIARPSAEAADAGRPVAWWSDGAPAVLEFRTATGCERSVGVEVPPGSDLLIAPEAAGFTRVLTAPCGLADAPRVAARTLLRDSMPSGAAWPRMLPVTWLREGVSDPLPPRRGWLDAVCLAGALLLLGVEHWWRQRERA